MNKIIKTIIIICLFILLAFSMVSADIILNNEKVNKCFATSWDDEGEILTTFCYEESTNIDYVTRQELIEWYQIAKAKIISQQEEIDTLRSQGILVKQDVDDMKAFICNAYPNQSFC